VGDRPYACNHVERCTTNVCGLLRVEGTPTALSGHRQREWQLATMNLEGKDPFKHSVKRN